MIDSINRQDEHFARDVGLTWAAGLLVGLALLWLAGAAFATWLAYDQCNLPNDTDSACAKTLDYRLRLYQPILAVLGALAALVASRRLSPRARRRGGSSAFAVPLALAGACFLLWIVALANT